MSGDYYNYYGGSQYFPAYDTSYYSPSYTTGYGNGYTFGSPYQVQSPDIASSPFAPSPYMTQLPQISPAYSPGQTPGLESVTVSSPAYSPTVQTPSFTPAPIDFSSPYFQQPYLTQQYSPYQIQTPYIAPSPINIASPAFQSPSFSPVYSPGQTPGLESVTVSAARSPVPVQTPAIIPTLPAFTPQNFPAPFIPYTPPTPARQPRAPSRGGSGGGSSSSPKPPQQQPPPAKPPQLPIRPSVPQQQQPQVTPQQQQQLAAMTPAQLQQLLNNPNLTPAQRQAVQTALAQKQAALQQQLAQARAGGGTGVPGNQTKQTAPLTPTAAAPVTPISFVVPLLVAAGVATAWQLTHHKKFRASIRRLRRTMTGAPAHA